MNNQKSDEKILQVKNLQTWFWTDAGIVKAVDGVSFDLHKREMLAIVGESGSGKSVTNLAIMNLIPNPPGKIIGGEVWYGGKDVLKLQGARKDEISFSRSGVFGKDLVLRYAGKSLTIENQFSSKSAVERIELGDGDYITSDKISKIIEDLNSYASDKGFVNFGEDKFRSNEQIAQIYASGWSN